jgi:hypothetical protein
MNPLKAWTIRNALAAGIVAGLIAMILWPLYAASNDWLLPFLVALGITGFCGLSVLCITLFDLAMSSPPRSPAGSDPGVRYPPRARAGGSEPHRASRAAAALTGMLARFRPRPYPNRETARKDRMCASKARKIMSRPMT